jgi:ElaB/YqjD/DUF883 family membrane-anchored ribosome-binding protein
MGDGTSRDRRDTRPLCSGENPRLVVEPNPQIHLMKMKHDSAHAAGSPDDMVEQVTRLMGEAEALLVGPVADRAGEKMAQLRERFRDLQSRAGEVYGDTREKVVASAKKTDETIRSHPYESLAIALGVGVLLGALLRRNR